MDAQPPGARRERERQRRRDKRESSAHCERRAARCRPNPIVSARHPLIRATVVLIVHSRCAQSAPTYPMGHTHAPLTHAPPLRQMYLHTSAAEKAKREGWGREERSGAGVDEHARRRWYGVRWQPARALPLAPHSRAHPLEHGQHGCSPLLITTAADPIRPLTVAAVCSVPPTCRLACEAAVRSLAMRAH